MRVRGLWPLLKLLRQLLLRRMMIIKVGVGNKGKVRGRYLSDLGRNGEMLGLTYFGLCMDTRAHFGFGTATAWCDAVLLFKDLIIGNSQMEGE